MNDALPLLQVVQLCHRYHRSEAPALQDISFDACRGEVVALTGPSGCGKSTLLSLIGLLDHPTSGHITLLGQNLSSIRQVPQFRARHIGFVFQFHHMVPTMTLQENIEAPMLALGTDRKTRQKQAAELLEQMGLAHRAAFLPAHVSGGERQRAAVARALANRPALILADEPTGNLDTRNGERVVDLLTQHAKLTGALVLIATHNPEISRTAHRCMALRDGQLISNTP
ncbi:MULTISPECIES: ABC transporter ATP-binding protein [Giesbergeria]|uniref:ABC transporter ATP-binding protein n=1 Tax=Giesbergeria sinuosa TaxID=80883 RepID=A0ABV9QBP2_9BURK